jgi:hypothetical protein
MNDLGVLLVMVSRSALRQFEAAGLRRRPLLRKARLPPRDFIIVSGGCGRCQTNREGRGEAWRVNR